LPNDGTPIYYLVSKGEPSILGDPLFAYLVGIPTSVITSLFANLLYEKRRRARNSEGESGIVLAIEKDGNVLFYSETGTPLPQIHAERILKQLASLAETLNTALRSRAMDPQHRFPIYLDHTDKIIGWTHLQEDDHGLKMKNGTFHDPTTWDLIDSGKFRGFSIRGIARESECSICGKNYSECNHISGLEYNGEVCVNKITNIDLAEVSLVREPVNQDCLIDLRLNRKT
jgi:hypothetical protein